MESKLASLVKVIAEAELQCDIARYALREAPGFDPKKAFDKIDKYHRGALAVEEIKIFLIENNVVVTESEVLDIINSYDRNQTGRIGITEFAEILTPKAFPFTKRPEDHKSLHDLDLLLKIIFERELNLIRVANPLRAAIQDAKAYTPLDLFRFVDASDRSSFSYQDLDEFMQKQGFYLSNVEVLAFFRRVDKNNSSRISYLEFKTYVLPDVSSGTLSNTTRAPYEPYDYLAYNSNKYVTKPLSSSTLLDPSRLTASYTLNKGSPYKKTPYLSSVHEDSYDRALNSYSRTSTASPLVWEAVHRDTLSNTSLPRPQIPQHTFYNSDRPSELLKYRDFYPHTTGKYFDDHYYPFVRRYLHYPLKYDSQHEPSPVNPTTHYSNRHDHPYSTHHYYPDHFHPSTTAKREREVGFLPDPTGYKRSYDEIPTFDQKFVTMRDLYYYPKMVETNYRKSAGDTFYSTHKDRKSISPQKELNLGEKPNNWKLYAKAFDDNYVNYGPEREAWSGNKASQPISSLNRYDLASTATSMRADMLMSSAIWRNPKLTETADKNGASQSRLYDISDIKEKYRNVKDYPQSNFDFPANK